MKKYPRPIEGSNVGDGSPLVLGDDNVIGDLHAPCDPTIIVHVLDWDGDGERELVCSGNDIYSHKFIDALPDGTPIVDRGLRWGTISRSAHRDENDEGLTGYVLAAGDFSGNGNGEAILGARYYSKGLVVAMSLAGGISTSRKDGRSVAIEGLGESSREWDRGSMASIDWNGDGTLDLVVVGKESPENHYLDPKTATVAEDQQYRYYPDGKWMGALATPVLQVFQNTGTGSTLDFTFAGKVDVRLPKHTMWVSVVNPTDPKAGLLLLTYYGRVYHLPLISTGSVPQWGQIAELTTLHGESFNSKTNFDMSLSVSDVLEPGRFDIFAGDRSQSPSWSRYYGQDSDGRPVYDTPKKIKQRNPHIGNSFFSVPTTGDWRGTGTPDLVVGGVEGYIYWYKTLSADPLRFAPPERLRTGTTEIRRLAAPNPAGGHNWGGSQGPYDGDTGGYSNPVLVDWDGDGLLDLLVSDMVGLFDWYPNWGSKTDPELGPPQRLHLTTGEPLRGPWRQKAGVGDFTGRGLPDIVIQDKDLDLALFRRVGTVDLSKLHPGEKLRYEDGETIKTHGTYTPGGGDGRGRTKINVLDWDHDGVLDMLIGVGPQHESPFRASYVLFFKNVGSNESPLFKRPEIILWNEDGKPLEFWRHGVHPEAVDWNGDGKYELLAGADQGRVWYWKSEHFGASATGDPTAPRRPDGEQGLGRDD